MAGTRLTAMSCRSTDSAELLKLAAAPRLAVSCRVATSAGTSFEVELRSGGSWSNVTFQGQLVASDGRVWQLASQNAMVLGTGAARGFDVRDAQGRQVAAIDLTHVPEPERPPRPTVWLAEATPDKAAALLPTGPTRDAVSLVMALLYTYPWPSACDARRLSAGGLATAPFACHAAAT